jgi:hypothetical protein
MSDDATPQAEKDGPKSRREELGLQLLNRSDAEGAVPLDSETDDEEPEDSAPRTRMTDDLVVCALANNSFFHDANRDAFAQHNITGETRRVDGQEFRDWLVAEFYGQTGKSPSGIAVKQATDTLAARARFDGQSRDVFVRCAVVDGIYYLDLAQPGNRKAIQVLSDGWQITETHAIAFVRSRAMQPQPGPIRGGSLLTLWNLVDIPEPERPLVVAWLIDSMRPDTPFPVLELIGEQGSAKSTTQFILRMLIDPNSCNLRATPKTREDIFVSAGASWLTSYEDVSHLAPEFQDALCTLATGGGFAKRKLYTDADESVIKVKRPIVLNGISAAVTAQDLVSRTISVELPTVLTRVEHGAIAKEFERQRPLLLGALLDAFASALRCLPSIHIPVGESPRLIEYVRLGMAISQAAGDDPLDFYRAFSANCAESIGRTLDASPVATAVVDWFVAGGSVRTELTVSELKDHLERYKPSGYDTASPKSAKGLADQLRRQGPALRMAGVTFRSLGKQGRFVRYEFTQIKSCKSQVVESGAEDLATCDLRDFETATSAARKGEYVVDLP